MNKKGINAGVVGAISVVIALVIILNLSGTVSTAVTSANTTLATSYSDAAGLVILIPLIFVAGILLFVVARFVKG